ncbi:MAG: hypothetical protein LRY62_01595 [Alphaproteobacteria bacterium]|nr:hypothetical protein [Alphaproteobacteria bacterium]
MSGANERSVNRIEVFRKAGMAKDVSSGMDLYYIVRLPKRYGLGDYMNLLFSQKPEIQADRELTPGL